MPNSISPNLNLVLASGNKGKLTEFSQLLAPLGWQVQPQSNFNLTEAEETGLTFVENALIKARHAAKLTGLPALADDSGLEVDALKGTPGIYSARYAGAGATDAENNALLLENLAGVAAEKRNARFWCVLAFLRWAEDPTPVIVQASWEGKILEAASGSGGFGYDPIFYVPSQQLTAAELSPEIKNQLSHRGKASQLLLTVLQERFGLN